MTSHSRTLARWACVALFLAISAPAHVFGDEAEFRVLSKDNWDDTSAGGKEADNNYGDYVIRNDQIVCVIAAAKGARNANMTVRGVGGSIIDLSFRRFANDQLSAFYPLAGRFSFNDATKVRVLADGKRVPAADDWQASGKAVTVAIGSSKGPNGLTAEVRYTLAAKSGAVTVATTIKNPTDKEVVFDLTDGMRADRTFVFASQNNSLFTATDEWFRQCYGVYAPDHTVSHKGGRLVTIRYQAKDGSKPVLAPEQQLKWSRRIFPAGNNLRAKGMAERMDGAQVRMVKLSCVDPNGPINAAKVTVKVDGKTVGFARTYAKGEVRFPLAAKKFAVEVEAVGRPKLSQTVETDEAKLELQACGYLQGRIDGEDGKGIPCKVAIFAKEGGKGKTPYYGPDSASWGVQNLRYVTGGKFKCELTPGDYEIVVSRGPEYDAHFAEVTIKQNETTAFKTLLNRVVNTEGWISADYHSHSSPSGDNTGSQFGRVQNLLAEQIEFAPCTEHNRISTYVPHLDRLKAHRWMATCTGMELTGGPLPVNHQNAFPLIMKPHTQDNGGPLTDVNPVVQIERLAMWDDGAEKLVQANHPNLVQILGDKDLNGKFDGGFQGMFGFMDVMEVHPPIGIFNPPEPGPVKDLPRNPMFHWLQLMNLGYRIVGVVNTDAHYNFHGSGWIRNYVKSSTDAPAEIDTMEMVRASKKGLIVMTTGPFMEVNATAGDKKAMPGQDLAASDGNVQLHVRVQCANWLDVNRVQVFVNGRPSKQLNFTRRSHPELFRDGVVKFDHKMTTQLKQDAHVIVAAVGEGLKLGRVAGPRFGNQAPVAVANPVFVDVDGGGFKANGDLLDLPIPVK